MEAAEARSEAWAKAQIEQDQPIRFPADWPDADRSLSGAFVLNAILDARWAEVPEGFVLANSVVTTLIDRRYAHVQSELTFEDCTFVGAVKLPYGHLERRVRFRGCTFAADFDMNSCHATELWFGESEQHGQTVFHAAVDLNMAELDGHLLCSKAQLLSQECEASFNGCKVAGVALFTQAIFQGPADFMGAEIGGQLNCTETQFLSQKGKASFNGCKVAGMALFSQAIFQGPVDFDGAKIGGQLDCAKARFISQETETTFNGCKVGGLARFTEAIFQGPVDFGSADIGGQLLCTEAQFLNQKGKASFNGCKVSGLARFNEAIFQGPVDFRGAEIGGQLNCSKAQFLNKEGEANFNGCTVKGTTFFQEAIFWGRVNLSVCKLSVLRLAGARFARFLDFSHTAIAGALYVFSPTPDFSERSKLDTTLPPSADLRALTYDRTDLDLGEDWTAWIGLRRSPDSYDPGPHFTLERSFRRAGREDLADKVHYAMRQAEAEQLRRQRRFDKLLWNWFLRWTVGYGVYGYRLIIWALGLLGVSYAAIRWAHAARFIQAVKSEAALPSAPYLYATKAESALDFSPFLYMVNLLLFNVASLEKQYQPMGWWIFVETAMRLCAWILVPLAIAQLAGFVKKKE